MVTGTAYSIDSMRAVWRWLSPNELDRGASRSCALLAPLPVPCRNHPPSFDENLCLERGLELLTVQELAANVDATTTIQPSPAKDTQIMKTVRCAWHRQTTAWPSLGPARNQSVHLSVLRFKSQALEPALDFVSVGGAPRRRWRGICGCNSSITLEASQISGQKAGRTGSRALR